MINQRGESAKSGQLQGGNQVLSQNINMSSAQHEDILYSKDNSAENMAA